MADLDVADVALKGKNPRGRPTKVQGYLPPLLANTGVGASTA